MAMTDFLKKPKLQEPFTETTFECKRGDLTISGTEYRPEGDNLTVVIVSHGVNIDFEQFSMGLDIV